MLGAMRFNSSLFTEHSDSRCCSCTEYDYYVLSLAQSLCMVLYGDEVDPLSLEVSAKRQDVFLKDTL